MRNILFAILAALTFGIASPAEAGRGVAIWGDREMLDYVAETTLPNQVGEGKLSLCHRVSYTHFFFMPLYFSSEGYVLAPDRCDTEYYYDIAPIKLALYRNTGVLPADLPDEPELTLLQTITPFFWGSFALIVAFMKFRAGGFRRSAAPGPAAVEFRNRVLETSCRAALADGEIEDREVAAICAIAGQFTTGQVSPDQMRKMIGYVRVQPETPDLSHLGSGLDDTRRHQLLHVAMMVIGKDRLGTGDGKAFLDKLALDLMVEPRRRDALASSI